jgi:hypothetical protein
LVYCVRLLVAAIICLSFFAKPLCKSIRRKKIKQKCLLGATLNNKGRKHTIHETDRNLPRYFFPAFLLFDNRGAFNTHSLLTFGLKQQSSINSLSFVQCSICLLFASNFAAHLNFTLKVRHAR